MTALDNLSESQLFACRVIADHARSTAFSIADGILPGNEGRNYVLRKIMRRAIYHGREHLGFKGPFFYKVCDFVVGEMHGAFPELAVQRDFIGKMVRLEEERFGNTMTVGLGKLAEMEIGRDQTLNDELFQRLAKLYDTYGTPRDLIRVYLEEKGVALDEDEFLARFDSALQEIQKQSGVGQTQRKSEISPIYSELAESAGTAVFHGYDATRVEEAEVAAIVKGDARVDALNEGEEGIVILRETPFYAESGGQVGDIGVLFNTDAQLKVIDTFAPLPGLVLHKSRVDSGSLKIGDVVTAVVDEEKRDATRRNHTATHLVHAALKEVLGTHVKQAGSVVAPNYLRFDFTHYQPMTEKEVREVEDLVNRYILENHPVTTKMMAIEEAMRSGAVAMFGEKYGSEVRVLSVGDGKFSMELCGGTHVRATGDIGSFKITADEAIASGVRRIRAITGFDAFERFREDEVLINRSLGALKTQRDNLPDAIEKLQDEVKRIRRELEELRLKIATGGGSNGNAGDGDDIREIAGVKVLAKIVDGLDAGGMRQLSDTLLARLRSGVVVLGRREEGKAGLIVRVSDDLKDRVRAGNVIKQIVPILGGKGGGRPDMAEGGGPQPERLEEAINQGYEIIETFLTS
ncbi:MAG TPA: alanine--tRNA ligase [Pyrinomonadaceae bacterium]|nr:alanine--tRNA ligase [Pyrinomonadaceae bacterium]